MDKIKYRFLNYKTYSSFKTALDNNRILDDSIVFIQDKLRIWARGKEYVCDGPYTTNTEDGTLVLKNGAGDTILSITYGENGEISIIDGSGTKTGGIYATKDYVGDKLNAKQDKLSAGIGISIDGSIISSTLNTNVYEFVTTLGEVLDCDPNKIYILETTVDGETTYKQYKIKNGQWILLGDVSPSVDVSGYLKLADAANTYQPIGEYLTEQSLLPYALSSDLTNVLNSLSNYVLNDYLQQNFQRKGEYALKEYVDNNFVKKEQVYTENNGSSSAEELPSDPNNQSQEGGTSLGGGNSGTGGGYSTGNIAIDYELSYISANPVENRVITMALQTKATKDELRDYATVLQLNNKADRTLLNNYVTTQSLTDSLLTKQDHLTAGNGIKIVDNVISANIEVDTSIYTMVDNLPVADINENKIYILKKNSGITWSFGDQLPVILQDDENLSNSFTYIQYKWDAENEEWIKVGDTAPTIDLSGYMNRQEALDTFAPKASYATTAQLDALEENVENVYQQKGDYVIQNDILPLATKEELGALHDLSQELYVPKVAVYTEDEGVVGPSDPGWIPDDSSGDIQHGLSNMVLLTNAQYEALVRTGLVKDNTYYFTYEATDNWEFGGTFPIIFT